jgi:excisionase family DNA binding protein
MELLTVEQLADWLKLKPRTVRELVRERSRTNQLVPIPVIRVGRNVRFSRSAITEWLTQLQEQAS